ncbi:hypothetical protein FHL15_003548 [Xylaria flabelliformis]|uniref:O-methyltransferase C-terminal domain-containing protein n=1 Tax=Xylaria flabelliformis TaxID=2512241 RepID=A0A553I5W4_9PEZI|nr:hypothetical protein FHL15_003548 [Xylaria flabelliformis]
MLAQHSAGIEIRYIVGDKGPFATEVVLVSKALPISLEKGNRESIRGWTCRFGGQDPSIRAPILLDPNKELSLQRNNFLRVRCMERVVFAQELQSNGVNCGQYIYTRISTVKPKFSKDSCVHLSNFQFLNHQRHVIFYGFDHHAESFEQPGELRPRRLSNDACRSYDTFTTWPNFVPANSDPGGHETVKKLLSRVETREERLYDISFGQPIVSAALQTLLDLGLWKEWAAIGGGSKSVDQLRELCTQDCDPNLLRRLLRLLASFHIIGETGEDQYELTDLIQGENWKWIQCRTHHWDRSGINFPSFLAKTGYKEPQDAKNTNYADWCPGNLDFFGKCVADPAYQESFSSFMTGWARYKVPWPEFYDTTSLLEGADLSNGAVLCVDIGGHHGIDLTRLLDKHPDIPAGALVLQDLPEVLAGAKNLNGKIKATPHDMFRPQPMKGYFIPLLLASYIWINVGLTLLYMVLGSRSYYMHAVLHDWPDDTATQVLKNTAEAMIKGYSRLLIVDMVLPPTGISSIQAVMDVEMMANVGAYERTEAMWTKLINDAGLKIIKIWPDGRKNECLVEAELA